MNALWNAGNPVFHRRAEGKVSSSRTMPLSL
jgi:hypothetical protein